MSLMKWVQLLVALHSRSLLVHTRLGTHTSCSGILYPSLFNHTLQWCPFEFVVLSVFFSFSFLSGVSNSVNMNYALWLVCNPLMAWLVSCFTDSLNIFSTLNIPLKSESPIIITEYFVPSSVFFWFNSLFGLCFSEYEQWSLVCLWSLDGLTSFFHDGYFKHIVYLKEPVWDNLNFFTLKVTFFDWFYFKWFYLIIFYLKK